MAKRTERGVELFVVQIQGLGDDGFHQALGIGLVKDGEVLGPGGVALGSLVLVNVEPQNAGAQGVESANPQVLGNVFVDLGLELGLLVLRQRLEGFCRDGPGHPARANSHLNALLHFFGGFVGEGHRQNVVGVGLVGQHQVGDAVGEGRGFCLTRPRPPPTGGPLLVLDRLTLGWV